MCPVLMRAVVLLRACVGVHIAVAICVVSLGQLVGSDVDSKKSHGDEPIETFHALSTEVARTVFGA